MTAAGALVRVRALARRQGGRWIRRLGLLPAGEPDRLGEDDTLRDVVLPQRVLVFFPDTPTNLYQLEQWYAPLRRLHEQLPVVVITQDSRTTASVRRDSGLPVHCVARSATLDGLITRSDLALVLYVSHHVLNFAVLRHASLLHAYLGHGESDKEISASNQVKAYDLIFLAGRAGVERIRAAVPLYDVDRHAVLIGRPQLAAVLEPTRDERERGELPRVLYAPTWEGAQPSVAYSSIVTHGCALVRALLDAGLPVTYRPHPRTGANDVRTRAADADLRALVRQHPHGELDEGRPLAEAFAAADLLVTDVSSVALEWLPSGRPLVVTVPAAASARVPASPLLDTVPRLTAEDAPAAAARLTGLWRAELSGDDEAPRARAELVEHYLGDVTPGAALDRFVAACEDAVALRQRELARLAAGIPA